MSTAQAPSLGEIGGAITALWQAYGWHSLWLLTLVVVLGWFAWVFVQVSKRHADRLKYERDLMDPIRRSLEAIPGALEAHRAGLIASVDAGRVEARQAAEAHRRDLLDVVRVGALQAETVKAIHDDVREMRQAARQTETVIMATLVRMAQQVDTVVSMTVRRLRGDAP